MTEKSMGVTRTVIATVIGAALVGAAATLFAYFWPGNELAIAMVAVAKWAWAGVVYVGTGAWHLINAPVPLWAFVLLGVLCAWLWRGRARPLVASEIGVDGRRLIEVLAIADGHAVAVNIVAYTLDWPRIFVETVADDLRTIDIVDKNYDYYGPVYGLTATGKRFALAERLMGNQVLHSQLERAIARNSGRI